MNDQAHDKRALRVRLRERVEAMAPAEAASRSLRAADLLAAAPEFRAAQTVMIFLPLRYEIDARPLALRAWQQAKTVTVPLVSWEQKHMIPVEVRSLDEPMNVDQRGVSAPRTATPWPIDAIDLVVVPGLGFDRAGRRIGRGGGFYDRFLASPQFHGVTCGLAFEQQVIDRVPTAQHDIDLDMLVTDARVLRFTAQRPHAGTA